MTPRSARTPTQQRSRERQERIMKATLDLISEKGSDELRMGEVAQKAGIPIGSLYQYFPEKSLLIHALAQHFMVQGQQCTRAELSQVQHPEDLPGALRGVTEGYHQMYLSEPVMRDIWGATQADKVLQDLDTRDIEAHAEMLIDVLYRLYPGLPVSSHRVPVLLLMQLISATVRFAITLPDQEGQQVLQTFHHMVVEPFCKQLPSHTS